MITEEERAEIIAAIKREMFIDRENKNCLKPTLDKWCNTPDVYTSRMREAFSGDGVEEGAAWECIRKLTCKIMGVSYIRQINDTKMANEVADELCEVVSRLARKVRMIDG